MSRKVKQILVSLTIFVVVFTGLSLIAKKYLTRIPAPKALVTEPQGFWKDIRVTDDDKEISAPAFFCSQDGSYQGYIVDSGSGWWVVHKNTNVGGSFANQEFAKKYVESKAECK